MNSEPHHGFSHDFDGRITLYRTLRIVVVALVAGLLLKTGCIDTVAIHTDQMEPTLVSGDQILLGKMAYAAPGSWMVQPKYDVPVVFRNNLHDGTLSCLRIAGFPGDTVAIHDGSFSRTSGKERTYQRPEDRCPSLPADYSPRDLMKPYRLPQTGDTLQLDSLSLRDLSFALAIMKQENPHKTYEVIPSLKVDTTDSNDFLIDDFALFKGPLHAIPQKFATDWFFWDRLAAYIRTAMPKHSTTLRLSVLEEGQLVTDYVVQGECYFMLADNWCMGVDSRHFGPVSKRQMLGRARFVLWSSRPDKPRSFRSERIGKFVH